MSKNVVLDALAEHDKAKRVRYYNHAGAEVQRLHPDDAMYYLSLGNGKILDAQAEQAGQIAGLQTAVQALADEAGLDGQGILDAITAATATAVTAALPSEVTVPLEGPADPTTQEA